MYRNWHFASLPPKRPGFCVLRGTCASSSPSDLTGQPTAGGQSSTFPKMCTCFRQRQVRSWVSCSSSGSLAIWALHSLCRAVWIQRARKSVRARNGLKHKLHQSTAVKSVGCCTLFMKTVAKYTLCLTAVIVILHKSELWWRYTSESNFNQISSFCAKDGVQQAQHIVDTHQPSWKLFYFQCMY